MPLLNILDVDFRLSHLFWNNFILKVAYCLTICKLLSWAYLSKEASLTKTIFKRNPMTSNYIWKIVVSKLRENKKRSSSRHYRLFKYILLPKHHLICLLKPNIIKVYASNRWPLMFAKIARLYKRRLFCDRICKQFQIFVFQTSSVSLHSRIKISIIFLVKNDYEIA